MSRRARIPVLALTAITLAGCHDPYASAPAGSSTPQAVASGAATIAQAAPRATRTPVPGDAEPLSVAAAPPSAAPSSVATRSPQALARAYAALAINWDWRTLAGGLRRQRALAAGPLARELERTLAAERVDESLARDRPGGRGDVLAVAAQGGGDTRRLVVVTRERDLSDGRAAPGPSAHVYTATARRGRSGWRLTTWSREP